MSLWPKEHGAYGQMAFPLATAFAVAGVSAPALLTGLAILTGFLAHEPLMVLLGRRGARARRQQEQAAARWLAVAAITTVAAAVVAVWMTPPDLRWWFGLPLAPAALLAAAIMTRREKSWHAEIGAALAFSLAAVPLCLAAGASAATSFSVAIPFALIFTSGTLAVRVVILTVRGGGDPRGAAMMRAATLIVSVLGMAGLASAGAGGLIRWTALAAAIPGVLVAIAVAVVTPAASRLRTVGWTLVGASVLAAVTMIAGNM